MKKTRVLFFIYQMGAGGAARTLLNIINNLDREKFEPMLVTLNFNGSYESELKSDVMFMKLDTQRLSRSIFRLAGIIREAKVDIVFSTIPRVNTIAILAKLASMTNAKTVIREADNLGGDWKTDVMLRGFGFVYQFSNQIVSLSEGVKQNLVERYKVRPEQVEVIYNPVDLANIKDSMATGNIDPEHKKLFATDDKVIITAGRLVPQKDQHTLIKAFAKTNAKVKSRLLILGKGPLQSELEDLAEALGVGDRVHFLGFQNNPYIYFKQADLFALSSIHEGFSHVIAEALATGTPVVSTDCKSGPAEVLAHGKYGRLAEVGNEEELAAQMVDVLSLTKEQSEQVITDGYKRARDFDAKKMVRQYEEVFLNTVKNNQ